MKEKLETIRHSFAHILAQAVKNIYPDAKLGIGPAIEDGFYYDFGDVTISDKDLPKIEEEMRKIIAKELAFKKEMYDTEKAKKHFKDQDYKLELIEDFEKEGFKEVGIVWTGEEFSDLCRGGHVKNTKKLNAEAFKLTKTAGAYWKGSEKNKMLTRIYGAAFKTEKGLQKHLDKLEEAKKRDHKKLGKELDLFTFSDLVGAGLPLFTPKGTVIRNELQNYLLEISKKYGMQPVAIPHIAKKELYETSGHASKFGEELIEVKSRYTDFVMKPVNCPHHTQIYASQKRSYKDLPVRYMESTMQYRDEKPGEIGGLTRVRSITVDDGHIFCTMDQAKEEIKNICRIIEEFYRGFGLWGDHWVSLSVRNLDEPETYIGDINDWEKAEKMLEEISGELHLNAKRVEGEAAIYGPKIDYMFRDSLGREWQLGTVQLDFALPKRFKLAYTDQEGEEKTPVLIHRAILGSYERFLAILIEHFAGAFPLWLAPTQAEILPISEKFSDYANEVKDVLDRSNIRCEVNNENETFGKKIRAGKTKKTPYLVVVGEQEKDEGNITVESYKEGKIGKMSTEEFIDRLKEEINEKK